MKLKSFYLERYFSKFEFSSKYLLSSSDCDGLGLEDLVAMADPNELNLWQNLKLGYTESAGLPALREQIASLYKNISSEETVILSPGEANFICMNVLLNPDDHVICMAPAYQSLYEVANSVGCRVSFWSPKSDAGNNWYYDPEDLQKLFTKETKLLILNFPHNPTGYIPNQQDFERILNLAKEHHAWIFSDEMYHLLDRHLDYRPPPLCEVYDRGISLWGMAKSFALAGLRLGWVVCKQEELLKEIISYKDYLTICSSAPSEILALIGLRNKESIIKNNNEKIAKNIQLFDSFCKRYPHVFSFSPPKAGSTAFVKLLTEEPSLTFSEKLVQMAGIMTLPAEMFEFGTHHLRIGFGRKSMPEVIPILGAYLDQNYRAN